ncbi:hypothetical protein F5880DRAFT_93338 [Lentinula raphanica]|nr:hypothetical protein F5880DRAFT_93338 [Lentinula raphanica]
MFFQITPTRLFALLHVGASIFLTSASPVPSLNGDLAQYDRRADPVRAMDPHLTRRALQEDVELVISGVGKEEHWFVHVGPRLFQAGTRDPSTMDKFKSKLTTSDYEWAHVEHQLSHPKKVHLGKATFKDAADQNAAFQKLRGIRMKAPAAVKGGNCLDYITDVLDELEHDRHVGADVVHAYKQEYDENYARVSKAVWGVDLKP